MIELHCNSCGKLVRAPREAAGRQAKCPRCGNGVYIPTPEEELEELPLKPEDAHEREREAALQEERRRLDRILAHERGEADESAARPAARQASSEASAVTVEDAVIAYLMAMRDAELERAQQWLPVLQRRRSEALNIIDRLVADQLPPAAMANIPPNVYHGFLRNLRAQF